VLFSRINSICHVQASFVRLVLVFNGCELWCMFNDKIDSISATWRKNVRKIWVILQHTLCNILPLVCNYLPIIDEFCRRQVNLVKSCFSHVRRNITSLYTSFLICPLGTIIISHLNQSTNTEVYRAASFVLDLLFLRESSSSRINRPSTTDLSYDDVQCIIDIYMYKLS
jgi:hypothetical protein